MKVIRGCGTRKDAMDAWHKEGARSVWHKEGC